MAMQFEHEFTVPVPVEQAWSVLLDVERVAPCLPGAALDSVEGDAFTGRMKVKVGPITVTYRGDASFQEVDKDAHSVTIKAAGKESRGSGTANATVTARLGAAGDETKVRVQTSFNVTGRPAQFGRGVMADVGSRLIDRFAENLAALLRDGGAPAAPAAPAETAPGTPAAESRPDQGVTASWPGPTEVNPSGTEGDRHLSAVPPVKEDRPGTVRTSRTADEEALDLLEIAGLPVLKRLAPVAGGLAVLFIAIWLIRRLLRSR